MMHESPVITGLFALVRVEEETLTTEFGENLVRTSP
jgi:hypothetical protein